MIGMMIVSGYLFKKIPEKPVSIRAFEPPWGKRKAPVFVSKAGTYYGGRNRTRTCDPIDVNDVLCLGGKVCRKQMLGVHMPKNVDITGFSHFLPHPSGVRRMGVHWVFTPF